MIVAASPQWKGTSLGLLLHLPAALLFLFCWALTRCECDLHCVHITHITSLLINARDNKMPYLQPAHDVLWHFPDATTTWACSWQIVFCVLSWTQIKATHVHIHVRLCFAVSILNHSCVFARSGGHILESLTQFGLVCCETWFRFVPLSGPLNQGTLHWQCLCAENANQTLLDGRLTDWHKLC